jgi:hypothetical protein
LSNTDNHTINPYAPPNSTPLSCELRKVENHFAPLWIWLAVAIAASFLGTPADPVSMYIALAYGLLAFIVGCVLTSRLHISVRVVALTFWLIPGVRIGLGGVWFIGDMGCYGLMSLGMGVWAARSIPHRRQRILSLFCLGYAIGSLAGIYGILAGAAIAVRLATRSSPAKEVASDV